MLVCPACGSPPCVLEERGGPRPMLQYVLDECPCKATTADRETKDDGSRHFWVHVTDAAGLTRVRYYARRTWTVGDDYDTVAEYDGRKGRYVDVAAESAADALAEMARSAAVREVVES